MRNYRRKIDKKAERINIQKFNWELTISNNNKTRYNRCNKFTIEFMQSPSQIHYIVAKTKLRYLQGIKEYGIWYKPATEARLLVCIDSVIGLD
jgi:hypothetical protein